MEKGKEETFHGAGNVSYLECGDRYIISLLTVIELYV